MKKPKTYSRTNRSGTIYIEAFPVQCDGDKKTVNIETLWDGYSITNPSVIDTIIKKLTEMKKWLKEDGK